MQAESGEEWENFLSGRNCTFHSAFRVGKRVIVPHKNRIRLMTLVINIMRLKLRHHSASGSEKGTVTHTFKQIKSPIKRRILNEPHERKKLTHNKQAFYALNNRRNQNIMNILLKRLLSFPSYFSPTPHSHPFLWNIAWKKRPTTHNIFFPS